jgi:hypothetical protein
MPRRSHAQVYATPEQDEELLRTHFSDLEKEEERDRLGSQGSLSEDEKGNPIGSQPGNQIGSEGQEGNAMSTPIDEPETEGLDEEEEEETEEEEREVASPPSPPPDDAPAPPKRRRGRPPKAERRSGDPTGGQGVGRPPVDVWPSGAPEVWDRLVRVEAVKAMMSAADLYATVERVGLGPYQMQPVRMAPIDGQAIAGDDFVSPGEALMNYMMDVVHVRSPGPARYILKFMWRRSGGAKTGTLELGSPSEIAEQRAAAIYHRMQQPQQPQFRSMGRPTYPPQQSGYPQSPYPPYAPYPPPMYPPQQDNSAIEGARREIAGLAGQLNERIRMEAEARGAPPPPPVVVPTAAPAPALDEDARIARVVIGVLKGMGIGPTGPSVAAQQQHTGFGTVVDRAKEQVAGLRQLVGIFREVDKLREEAGFGAPGDTEPPPVEVSAKVEDPNAPAFGVRRIPFTDMLYPERGEDEGWLEWLTKAAMANPDRAAKFAEIGLKVLDQGAFGTLLRTFAAQGGPAAQVASAMHDRVANGAGVGAPPPPAYPPHGTPSGGGTTPPTSYPAP